MKEKNRERKKIEKRKEKTIKKYQVDFLRAITPHSAKVASVVMGTKVTSHC